MKRIYNSLVALTLLLAGSVGAIEVAAQAPSDAYRNNIKSISGTARAQGLGGAVGAVGADPTAVHVNPAGIGLYLQHTLSGTLEVSPSNSTTEWTGLNSGEVFTEKNNWVTTSGNFSVFSPVVPRSSRRDFNVNWGISYNRDHSYTRSYELITSLPEYGLSDYMAFQANLFGMPNSTKNISPIVDIARDAAFIEAYTEAASVVPVGAEDRYRSMFSATLAGTDPQDGMVHLFLPLASNLKVAESGYKSSYDFTVGMGYLDRFYFGGTLRVTNHNYNRAANYREDFQDHYNNSDYNSYLEYGTYLDVTGTSLGVNLGALVALGDYGRVGVSYTLPQLATFRETYSASASSYNDAFGEGDKVTTYNTDEYESGYGMTMPGELTLSAMAFFGPLGFVSYDFQYRNLGHSNLYYNNSTEKLTESDFIKEDYGAEMTHRLGVEMRFNRALTFRGGYSYTGNPMKAEQLRSEPSDGLTYNAVPSGYIVDFVLPRSYQTISAGLGYNITPALTLDLAYVHGVRTERTYPFSGDTGKLIVAENIQDNKRVPEYDVKELSSIGGDLTTTNHKMLVTLTYTY
ncbi:MAG: outer membrane protein transport protein [Porphyromonas sp.]|nr:outer membrane protein transport protein [Porphyromonas sp.]